MKGTKTQQLKIQGIAEKVGKRNDGKSIVSFIKENDIKKPKGRPKKNAVMPETEREIRYTFVANEANIKRLQEIAYNERIQIKGIFNYLIGSFISEYDKQNN